MSHAPGPADYPALLRRAYASLEKLQAKLDSVQRAQSEPIAIVGLGCRFPGGVDGPESFWDLLRHGKNAITETPPGRWEVARFYDPNPGTPGKMYSRWGGFLDGVDLFDAQFFGIAPREAVSMDPQQRLVLEVAWEALEHAGQAPDGLAGTQTGVFVGISSSEYAQLVRDPAMIGLYTPTGIALSVAAGRLSYLLGLQGPSLAVDTACSSSLTAVHLAVQSLRGRECGMALAGGVNLMLSPASSIGISELRMLAPDGRCKTFDAAADGFVRAEGCGMVVLKRLSDAMANHDRILALIRGSAVNQDGRSGGLTAPNGPAQEAVIRRALANGGVAPAQVQYVEAHGTGTSLGDPIEVQALAAALGEGRNESVAIGSVKTNIGHCESAAGVAGLIKTVLALRHGEFPPHLHLHTPSPHIDWEHLPVVVHTQTAPWPRAGRPRLAGVSSFGFSGTNAHVILEEAPEVEAAPPSPERPAHVLTLSARSGESLLQLAARYDRHLGGAAGDSFADFCFTANAGRARFPHRLAIVACNESQARQRLAGFLRGEPDGRCFSGHVGTLPDAKLAFLFSGQGSQYAGMGRNLFETQPVFRDTVLRCEKLLAGYLELPLVSVLYPAGGGETPLDQTRYTQPALFAVEFALAELWQSWGVRPRLLAGHSVGEYVAAAVAGIFSLEDAIGLVAERGRLIHELAAAGAMAAILAPESVVRRTLTGYEKTVAVAAVNSPAETVISGDGEHIGSLIARFEQAGIRSRRLRASHAFHSPLMDSAVPAFGRAAARVRYAPAQIALVSSLTGRLAAPGEMEQPAYWVRQLREAVRFTDAVEELRARGCGIFLEIGPKPVLVAHAQQCLGHDAGVFLPSLREGRKDWDEMLRSLARLYVKGVDIHWDSFDRPYHRRRVSVPTYPFERKRYWLAAAEAPEPPATPSSAWKDWLYEIRWEQKPRSDQTVTAAFVPEPHEIASALESRRAALRSEHHLDTYAELVPQLDRLATLYIADALGQLGLRWIPGNRGLIDDLAGVLHVVPRHHRLLTRLIAILEEERFLFRTGPEYEVLRAAGGEPTSDVAAHLLSRYPEMSAEIEQLARCGRHLAEVLRGVVNPLEVLFPGGSLAPLEKLYRDSPAARACNALVARAVGAVLARLPEGRKIRILELGAGTGGATSAILPAVPRDAAEYVFTDISPQFTANAALKFRAFPFLRTHLLDIERDPVSQGFDRHRFDIVIAANVLHATAGLRAVLRHVEQLLAPGGLLVLLEAAAPQRWLDLIFGLTEGWWKFADHDLRPSHPLLPPGRWLSLLAEAGFANPAAISDDASAAVAEPALILARAPVTGRLPCKWLILADRQGLGERLAATFEERGDAADLIFSASDATGMDEVRRQLREAAESSLHYDGVIHLWSLDHPEPGALSVDALAAAQLRTCGSVLQLSQSLARWDRATAPRLWLVTRGAQPAAGEPSVPGFAQASLWGLGRVLALEHFDLWGGLVDLAPGPSTENETASLLAEILDPDGEDQIAFRGGARYAARLVPRDNTALSIEAARFRADATYLITGGLGDLGLEVAGWLVRYGARHLVLVGRTARRPEAIDGLERVGATVRIVAADVGDPAQMTGVFDQIQRDLPPLHGVIHAAAQIAPRTLEEMTLDDLRQALHAKVSGTWVLHQLTREMDLDFFVLFSSTTSLLGSRYLGHYAAANQFLDAFAHFRRSLGLPALAINWGIWDPARVDSALGGRSLGQIGLASMRPAEALSALAALLGTSTAQAAVAAIDWRLLKPLYEARRRRPFLEHLNASAPSPKLAPSQIDLLRDLEGLPSSKRRQFLVGYLQREVSQVLGFDAASLPDAHQGFFEIGMDSLTSVDLQRRLENGLGRSLPTTVALEYPTIEALAGYLEAELFPPVAPPAGTVEPLKAAAAAGAENLDQLSKDDLLSLIEQELTAIQERKLR